MEKTNSSGLRWENLALDSGKPIEIPGFCMSSSSGSDTSSSKYPISISQETTSKLDGFGKLVACLPPYRNMYDDIMRLQNNISDHETISPCGEPMIGLRLGTQKEYGDTTKTPTKRTRASHQNMQNPCCQVQGCNLDLKSAKDYHGRHRICETHSKSPKVIVAGMECRFCQQCSRFHDLSEFDDKKRSCRRRLSEHNARRRKVQPDSMQLTSPGLSSALYDEMVQQNVLLNGLPVSFSNASRHSHAPVIRPSNPHFSNDDHIHSSNSGVGVLHHCLHVSTNSHSPDLLNARSLLSSNSWSLNEGDSSSVVHGNYNHTESGIHNLSLFHSHEQEPPQQVHSLNLHNAAATSHHQQYRLFRPPHDSPSF